MEPGDTFGRILHKPAIASSVVVLTLPDNGRLLSMETCMSALDPSVREFTKILTITTTTSPQSQAQIPKTIDAHTGGGGGGVKVQGESTCLFRHTHTGEWGTQSHL